MTSGRRSLASRVHTPIWLVTVVVAAATAIGLVVLWPTGEAPDLAVTTQGIDYVDCDNPLEGLPTQCQAVEVSITSGPTDREAATFLSSLIDFSTPRFEPGDRVVLAYNDLAPPDFQYVFVEFQRDAPLALLGIAFATGGRRLPVAVARASSSARSASSTTSPSHRSQLSGNCAPAVQRQRTVSCSRAP